MNGFGLRGAASLAMSLSENRALLELDISNNRIVMEGAAAFGKIFSSNDTLRVLKVSESMTSMEARDKVYCRNLWLWWDVVSSNILYLWVCQEVMYTHIICVYTRTYMYTYTRMYICTHTYTCVYVYTHIICVYTHRPIHLYVHILTCTHLLDAMEYSIIKIPNILIFRWAKTPCWHKAPMH